MPQVPPSPTPASSSPLTPFAAHLSLWFTLLAFAVGAAPFVLGAQELVRPALVIAALAGLATVTVIVHALPALRSKTRLQCLVETAALLGFAFLVTAATGGVRSSFLSLLLLPLTVAAISLPRLVYASTAVLAILAYVLLGLFTPGAEIASAAFTIRLIGTLAPALVATAAIAVLIGRIQAAEQQISDLSAGDALTGLYNARSFEQRLVDEHRKSERLGKLYSVVKIELDNLAQVGDSAGRDAANQIVLAVSAAIARSVRSSDVAARLGGAEFAALLVGADPTTAATIGQRIRNSVYAGTISVGNRLLRANVSLGIASFPRDQVSWKELLSLADERLEQDRAQRAARP